MKLSPTDISKLAVEPGGHRFTAFVDTLIRTEAAICNIAQTDIHTNLKTNAADGGVDTKIDVKIPSLRSKWMEEKTVWQYKASPFGKLTPSLVSELKKEFSSECISNGYAYRTAVCDSIPAETVTTWNDTLTAAAREINPESPQAFTVHADTLADWANEYPALIINYFPSIIPLFCLHMDAWQQSMQSVTPEYLKLPESAELSSAVLDHVDLAKTASDVLLSITGESGVGKTRLVFEALKEQKLEGLVLYSDDDDNTRQIARFAAGQSNSKVVIIADECSPSGRDWLRKSLDAFKNRIRVIAIESTGIVQATLFQNHTVTRPTLQQLETILQENFPQVSSERRHAYAKLCEGFVHPAADLCKYDRELSARGIGLPTKENIRDYFHSRLTDNELEVLQALALFSKVGYREDVASELEQLCALVDIEKKLFLSLVHKIHDKPGYIKRLSRYISVAPAIITQMAFDEAWNRWIKPDVNQFLNSIPPELVPAFIENASHASEENRQLSGNFFRQWAASVTATQLADIGKMGRMASLAAMDPSHYLPMLTRIIVESSDDEIRGMSEKKVTGWPSRRRLIFFLERMASFENTFDFVEPALYRLAQCETEKNIGNNSTKEWGKLFQIALSGSPEPFSTRFIRFKERLLDGSKADQVMAFDTFSDLLTEHHSSFAKDIVLGGRIAPTEWFPKTRDEYTECYKTMFAFLTELHQQKEYRFESLALVLRKTNLILKYKCFDLYKSIVEPELDDPIFAVKVMKAVDEHLFIHRDEHKYNHEFIAQLASIRTWINSRRPQDFHGRLIAIVGENHWNHLHLDMATVEAEYLKLAEELLDDSNLFEKELSWLLSPDAYSAFQLGHQMGRLDQDAILLDQIVSSLKSDSRTGFIAGYVLGLTIASSQHNSKINTLLDELEIELPVTAFAIFSISRAATNGFKRALRLIQVGKLELYYLQSFALGVPMADFTLVEMKEALMLILERAKEGDERAPEIGIHFLAAAGMNEEIDLKARRLIEPEIEPLVWELLELPITRERAGREAYWWQPIMKVLVERDCKRATALLADSLVCGDLAIEEVTIPLLVDLAQKNPLVVLSELKRLMTTEGKEWRFLFKNFKPLFAAFDPEILIEWLKQNDIEIARFTARHLPRPSIDESGQAVVPTVTEFALEKFGTDDGFFQEFVAGSNSGEVFVGDPATRSDLDANTAKCFFNHRLESVRKWAQVEFDSAVSQATYWRKFQEEMDFS